MYDLRKHTKTLIICISVLQIVLILTSTIYKLRISGLTPVYLPKKAETRYTPKFIYSKVLKANYTYTNKCLSRMIAVKFGARFGNKVMEYALTWSLAKIFHLVPVMSISSYQQLNTIYRDLHIQPINDYFDQLRIESPECGSNLSDKTPLKVTCDAKRLKDVRACVLRSNTTGEPVIVRSSTYLPEVIIPFQKQLRGQFHLREDILGRIQKELREIHKKMKAKTTTGKKKVVFVGVHARRTDFIDYVRNRIKGRLPDGVAYYSKAVTRMQADLLRLNKNKAVIAFVVVCDDIPWCKEILLPTIVKGNQIAQSKAKSNNTEKLNMFLMSHANDQESGFDFALLSSCNHSVIGYGMFGVAAAFLAGGKTLVYDITLRKGAKDRKEKPITLALVENLPTWKAFSHVRV